MHSKTHLESRCCAILIHDLTKRQHTKRKIKTKRKRKRKRQRKRKRKRLADLTNHNKQKKRKQKEKKTKRLAGGAFEDVADGPVVVHGAVRHDLDGVEQLHVVDRGRPKVAFRDLEFPERGRGLVARAREGTQL